MYVSQILLDPEGQTNNNGLSVTLGSKTILIAPGKSGECIFYSATTNTETT